MENKDIAHFFEIELFQNIESHVESITAVDELLGILEVIIKSATAFEKKGKLLLLLDEHKKLNGKKLEKIRETITRVLERKAKENGSS